MSTLDTLRCHSFCEGLLPSPVLTTSSLGFTHTHSYAQSHTVTLTLTHFSSHSLLPTVWVCSKMVRGQQCHSSPTRPSQIFVHTPNTCSVPRCDIQTWLLTVTDRLLRWMKQARGGDAELELKQPISRSRHGSVLANPSFRNCRSSCARCSWVLC